MNIIDKARSLLSDFIKEEVLEESPFEKTITAEERKEFIKSHLKELLEFPFWKIQNKNKEKYVFSKYIDYEDIDGDRIKISYIIYYLLWGNKDKDKDKDKDKLDIKLEPFLNYKTEPTSDEVNFSGDTICTFNTLFRKKNIPWFINQDFEQLKINRDEIKNDSINIFNNDELKEINDFRLKYQTIPNFYPLPCKTIYKNGMYISINSFRGDNSKEGWHDYFDTFLNKLEESLDKEKIVDPLFKKLIDLNGDIFFNKYSTRQAFVKLFYLEDFDKLSFNEEYKNGEFEDLEQYKEFALNYIREVTNCINKRSERLETNLREKINEFF